MKRNALFLAALLAFAPLLFATPAKSQSLSGTLNTEREHGLLITRILPDSPAERAGIVRGDILVRLDGKQVSTSEEVRQVLANHSAGDTILAEVIHGSSLEKIPIKLEVRLYHPILGMDFSGDRIATGTNGQDGVSGAYVDSVVPGGPADKAGIRAGDLILSVDGTQVDSKHSLSDIIRRYSADAQISVRVERPNRQELTLSVQLGKSSGGGPLLGLRYSPAPPRQSAFGRLFRSFSPPRWFRYFGEPLLPKQVEPQSQQGTTSDSA